MNRNSCGELQANRRLTVDKFRVALIRKTRARSAQLGVVPAPGTALAAAVRVGTGRCHMALDSQGTVLRCA